MVKTKSVYDQINDDDGERILVTRYWPRGLSRNRLKLVEWIHCLAPSRELLKDWNNGKITWQEYELRYAEEMQSQQGCIARLREISTNKTITLLCFEKEDNSHCHRHILRRLIEGQAERSAR